MVLPGLGSLSLLSALTSILPLNTVSASVQTADETLVFCQRVASFTAQLQ